MAGQEERLNQDGASGPVLAPNMREQWAVLSVYGTESMRAQ